MQLFVCWDGDHIGRAVGRAVLSDDVAEVRRVDQAINSGNEIWRSFALRCGGSVIEIGGDEGRIQVEASHLAELPAIAEQYAKAVGATVSVGVGMKLSDSAKALLVAKLRGGSQTTLWHPDMQRELDAATPKSEGEKIADEYLGKADQHLTGKLRGEHAGFAGHSVATAPAVMKPKVQREEHSEVEAAKHTIAEAKENMPPPPEGTHAARDISDIESELHQHAQVQEDKDQHDAQAQESNLDGVKAQVVQVLQQVREQLPVLQQLQQASPETYQAIMSLVQGVILLGREVMGEAEPDPDPQHINEALGKTEELEKAIGKIKVGRKMSEPEEGTAHYDYSHVLPKEAQSAGYRLRLTHVQADGDQFFYAYLHSHNKRVGWVEASTAERPDAIEPHSGIEADHRGKGFGVAMYEAVYAHAKRSGIKHVKGGQHSEAASRVHQSLSRRHGLQYQPKAGLAGYTYTLKGEMNPNAVEDDAADLEKAGAGPTPGAPSHHHLHLPAGSVVNGKMKVKHADGTSSWKAMRAGQIQAEEPNAPLFGANSHPTSSREPGGR